MENFTNLKDLLSQVNWETVTEDTGFDDLPEGYYLCEVEKAELKVNKNQTNQQVSFQFKVVESGKQEAIDNRGHSYWQELANTQNRKIFKHYPFKDVAGVKRFVMDMLKFEGEEPNVPLLEKEYFMMEETINDALDILVGRRIYIQAVYRTSNGKQNCWYDIVGWDRAREIDLPV